MAGAVPALADELDALDALERAAPSAAPAPPLRAWQAWVEVGAGVAQGRAGTQDQQRMAWALRWDAALGGPWRSTGALRLDAAQPGWNPGGNAVPTVQEATLAWSGESPWAFDLGRLQTRFGVASTYNPTDYLRPHALRATPVADPLGLRDMRQGSVLLRAQWLGPGGALALLLSPALGSGEPAAPADAWDLNTRATNPADRALLSISPRWSERASVQALAFADARQHPQWGLNATALWGQATVLHAEGSWGRARSQRAQAWQLPEDSAWQERWSLGATYTTARRLSLTLETSFNSAAPDGAQWQQLQAAPEPAYGAYRAWAWGAQELSTRRSWAVLARWEQALDVPHLELAALLRMNTEDASQLQWLQARYRWGEVQGFVQWQRTTGSERSDWGALPQGQAWMVGGRWGW